MLAWPFGAECRQPRVASHCSVRRPTPGDLLDAAQSKNLVNQACSTSERIVLQAMDHLLWSLSVLCHFYRRKGAVRAVDFTLSTGERLSGHVHPDWAKAGASMRAPTLDLNSACKQLPLSPRDFDKSVVVLKGPSTGRFLASSCEHSLSGRWPRYTTSCAYTSLLLHALGCHLGACWAAYSDDYPMATHRWLHRLLRPWLRVSLSLQGLTLQMRSALHSLLKWRSLE